MRKFDITIFFINFIFNYKKFQKILYLMIKIVLFIVIKIKKISYKLSNFLNI